MVSRRKFITRTASSLSILLLGTTCRRVALSKATSMPTVAAAPVSNAQPIAQWKIPWTAKHTSAAEKHSYYPKTVNIINAVLDMKLDNTGEQDCTATIAAKIAEIDANFTSGEPGSNSKPEMLFFPAGVYLVSDEIVGDAAVMIKGESRDSTIFRLKANSSGYEDAAMAKAVLRLGHGRHDTYRNYLADFTIEVDKGNAGAIALAYTGHNNSAIHNIKVKDTADTAFIGISIGKHPIPTDTIAGVAVGIFGFADVVIEGFEIGLRVHEVQLSSGQGFLNLAVSNQRAYGIYAEVGGARLLYNVVSNQSNPNSVGFCQISQNGDRATSIVNCKFDRMTHSSGDVPAIKLLTEDGSIPALYVQNTAIDLKYGQGLLLNNIELQPKGLITEYYKGETNWGGITVPEVFSPDFTPQIQSSIPFPHDEIRYYSNPNPGDWAVVPANPTTAQLQATFSSGKPCIALQGDRVLWNEPISIPPSVLLFNPNRTGIQYADSIAISNDIYLLEILGSPNDPPLEIRDLIAMDGYRGDNELRYFIIRNRGGRTLVINSWIADGLMLTGTPGICLINHLVAQSITVGDGWQVYAQNLDLEQRNKSILKPNGKESLARIYAGKGAQVYVNFIKTEAAYGFVYADANATVSISGHFHANDNGEYYFYGEADNTRFSATGIWIFGGSPFLEFMSTQRGGVRKEFSPQNMTPVSSRSIALAVERST
jgi:Pectate lyase superfamily protein